MSGKLPKHRKRFLGLMKLGILILHRNLGTQKREEIESRIFRFGGHQVGRTVTLLLSLVSTIEHHFAVALQDNLLELWYLVTESIPETKEVFDKRYARFWPTLWLTAATSRSPSMQPRQAPEVLGARFCCQLGPSSTSNAQT